MKLKLMPFIAGAVALSLSAPLVVKAQTKQPTQPTPRQQAPQPSQTGGIQLSPKQQEQLAQIRQQTRAQIQQILKPEQQKQFQEALSRGQNSQAAFAAMNLSEDQQTQLLAIVQSARVKTEAILTPQQRQQLQQQQKPAR